MNSQSLGRHFGVPTAAGNGGDVGPPVQRHGPVGLATCRELSPTGNGRTSARTAR
jgi:hypothetical protein